MARGTVGGGNKMILTEFSVLSTWLDGEFFSDGQEFLEEV